MGLLDRIAEAPCRVTDQRGRRYCETHRRPEADCIAARLVDNRPAWQRNPNLTTKEISR